MSEVAKLQALVSYGMGARPIELADISWDAGNPSATSALKAGLGASSIAVLLIILWGSLVPITFVAASSGIVDSDSSSHSVQHPDGGVVQKICVHDGETVSAGQTLVVLDGVSLRSDLASAELALYQSEAARARLDAERTFAGMPHIPPAPDTIPNSAASSIIAAQTAIFASRRDTWRNSVQADSVETRSLIREIASLIKQKYLLSDRRTRAEVELSGLEQLRLQMEASSTRVRQASTEVSELRSSEADLDERISGLRSKIDIGKLNRQQAIDNREEARNSEYQQVDARIPELFSREQQLAAQVSRLTVRAMADGEIANLALHSAGAVIPPGFAILDIVPLKEEFYVTASVSPRDLDRIRVGSTAEIRMDNLGAQYERRLVGDVVHISKNASVDRATGGIYYAVRIGLTEKMSSSLGNSIRTGVPVAVVFKERSQTMLKYLLGPLLSYYG